MFLPHLALDDYPISSCFYIVGEYEVVDRNGTAAFQSWIDLTRNRLGIMAIDIPEKGEFFLQPLDFYKDSIFRHVAWGLTETLLADRYKKESLERGSNSFETLVGGGLNCMIRAKVLRPDAPNNISFYQSFIQRDLLNR